LLGTIVNTMSIIIGSLIGLFFKGNIPEKYSSTIMHAMGLAVVLIGIQTAIKTDAILVVIISLAIGSLLGELIRIEDRLDQLGHWIGRRLSKGSSGVSKGFVTASLLYCVGAMAIVGSMESGLTGNHQTLFAKSDSRWDRVHHICINPWNWRTFFRCFGFRLSRPNYDNRIFNQTPFIAGGGFPDVCCRRAADSGYRNQPFGNQENKDRQHAPGHIHPSYSPGF
jgi:hypothetical protein